jgi:selenocysteine lyase/cysteine desulfurase
MVLQMAAVRLPRVDRELANRLFEEHGIEVEVSRAGELLRISIAPYNDGRDVDRLLAALGRELRRQPAPPALLRSTSRKGEG